jgi:murein L,D-transpeptidase YcbB/YkuD
MVAMSQAQPERFAAGARAAGARSAPFLRAALLSLLLAGLPGFAFAGTPKAGPELPLLQPPPLPGKQALPLPQPASGSPAARGDCAAPAPASPTALLSGGTQPEVKPAVSKRKRAKSAAGQDQKGGGVLSGDPFPSVAAETASCTALAAQRYADIAGRGGWPGLAKPLGPRANAGDLALLRQRLEIESELSPAADAARRAPWDEALTGAVKHYQQRLGLKPSGVVDEATLKALNVPAADRVKELQASAGRLAVARDQPFDGRRIVVNIPAAELEAIEGGRVIRRYAAVIGGTDHQSPQIAAKATAIVINPTWTLPASIIKSEIIPKMAKNPRYLSRMKIEILDGRGRKVNPRDIDWSSNEATEYTLRQASGRKNSLGTLKIDMPNKQAVYMHDTPAMGLFARDYRFLSHGCVRVEGVYDLATWLLAGVKGPQSESFDVAAIKDAVKDEDTQTIKLKAPVPVVWVYLDGWESPDGTVHFRDDIYGLDLPASGPVAQAR